MTLGRHPACDIVLESVSVSRQHARILNIDGDFYVEDLHSRNGTLLNGRPVVQRQLLAEDDELGICDFSFTFHQGPSKRAVAPPASRRESAVDAVMFDDDRPAVNSTIMSKLTVSTGSTGLRLEVNAQAKLKALMEISQNLGRALGLAEVLPKLLDSLFTIFVQADRGFIVLRDPQSGKLVPKAIKQRRNDDTQTLRISRTIVSNVMTTKEAILSADAANDMRFDMSASIVDFHIRSMICAPLVGGDGEALGVIQLDALDQRNRFRQDDLEMLVSVACQAAFAVENAQLHETAMLDQAMKRELAVAHEVQRGFLPSSKPQIPEYDFFEFYEPASQLGGDYYDYIELPGGRLAIVVADVSGKGVSASLLMAKLSAETRYCLASESEPAQAIGRLNRVFCDAAWEDRFVTMVLAVLDPRHARGHHRQCRPFAAALALWAERGRAGGGRRERPAAGRRSRRRLRRLRPAAVARRFAGALHRRHHRGDERRRRALRFLSANGSIKLRHQSRRRVGPPHSRRRKTLRRSTLAER